MLQRLVQVLMFSGFLMAAKAAWPKDLEINWYDSPTSKDYSVLELCLENGDCHKLVHKNESINKKVIKEWVDKIIKIQYNIDKYKDKK